MLWLSLIACSGSRTYTVVPATPSDPGRLPTAADVARSAPDSDRSKALFEAMSTVLLHPRCANCHPTDDRPRQGLSQVVHDPPVWRGPGNHGDVGMRCSTCHQTSNQDHARVPGAPGWHLAPVSMGWIGQTPGQICEQLKDPERNGGKDLEAIHEHVAGDALVAWGWAPGADRQPAPGTQAAFAALTRAWIDTGAACPTP